MRCDKIKIAYVMPHSYEYLYPKEMSKFKSPDELDYKILCNSSDCEHKICKATQIADMEPCFYYFSNCTKNSMEFVHKYGHKMKKVPVNLKKGKYGNYGWEFSYTLLKELSKDNFDLIFVFTYVLNNLLPLDMYDILALYCKKNKYPLIARHGGGSAKLTVKGYPVIGRQWIKKLTLNMADKIIVPSQVEFSVLKHDLKIKEDKLVLLKDPVDFANFQEIPQKIAAETLDKNPAKKYILVVGRLNKGKGFQHVINILPKLINIYPNIVFLIVGYGPFENELRRLVIERKLENYVSFEGLVFHDTLKFYYNIADVFCLPSYGEGTPNVIQEAVVCNTPSIGTNVGGIPDMLSDGVGIIIHPRDDTKLFESIKKILDGDFKMNQEKRKRLLNEWSMENVGQRLKEIYKEVLDKY
jgi:glycosyltransferase involved in cell wall biosynthesis